MREFVWFITGASRGFGLEIARAALKRGDRVVATARSPIVVEQALGASERLLAVELDVTDDWQIDTAVKAALERFGRIDILVNNAGRGLLGAVEESSADEIRAVYALNIDGLLAVTRAVLPSMRAQRFGRVLNISSVGGVRALPGFGVYSSTKFAVEGLSEALHDELLPLGIRVMIVEPGVFRTDFLDSQSLVRTKRQIRDYDLSVGVMREWAQTNNHAQPGDPVKGAAVIVEVATLDEPPFRLQLGSDCVARIESKLSDMHRELEAWRKWAVSTDYGSKADEPAA